MYYLIKHETTGGIGSMEENFSVEFISDNKLKLTNVLKGKFLEALNTPEVELIDNNYKDEDIDESYIDCISDELLIAYYDDCESVKYVIVSDRDAKTI